MVRSLIAGSLLLASPLYAIKEKAMMQHMQNFIRNILGGLVVSLAASTATAERILIVPMDDGTEVVAFLGVVEQGSASRLDQALVDNPHISTVAMVSPGGSAMEAFLIAEVLSSHNVTAMVPEGYACLSACAIGFLGAKDYVVLGALGFHNMYIDPADMADIQGLDLLIMGQSFGVRTTVFFLSNGFEAELPLLISVFTTPEVFLVFTSTEDLMRFFARSETDSVTEYLEGNDIDQEWIDGHLWDTQRFIEFFGGDVG